MTVKHPMSGVDAFSPEAIARHVEERGVAKAKAGVLPTLALAVLAGAFIALGGVLATTIGTGSELGAGPTRLLMGVGFSVGLILVVIAGAELFTGNNLIVMSLVSRHIGVRALLRNWGLVYAGNLVGALSVVVMVYYARWWAQSDFEMGGAALAIADGKVDLSFHVAFVRGILANALVCLAVWLAMGGRSVTDKVLGIVFPITAFVAAGFEHSIANMYFIPLGMLLSSEPEALTAAGMTAEQVGRLNFPWLVHNLTAVTLGNIVGGAGMVGLVYWFIYLRGRAPEVTGVDEGSRPSEDPGDEG